MSVTLNGGRWDKWVWALGDGGGSTFLYPEGGKREARVQDLLLEVRHYASGQPTLIIDCQPATICESVINDLCITLESSIVLLVGVSFLLVLEHATRGVARRLGFGKAGLVLSFCADNVTGCLVVIE